MLFNSLAFAIFFPVVTIGYFLLNQRWRWSWLLLASCFFYMFFRPVYILILFFTIAVDYAAGILIEQSKTQKRKKWLLILSIIANVGVLALFKYYNFLNENISLLLGFTGHSVTFPFLEIMLPVGLSFHTFQAMSYTIEIYRGRQKAERHLGIYALYVMFYPQLVAGPIERPQNLIHQFREHYTFDYDRVSSGLRRMLWGLFKKMVIADRLSVYVDAVYQNPEHFSGWPLIWATLLFSIQIYCDFSGYCDIALGSARVMGFKLMENFNYPYFSASFREFWTRWHISLSGWFRDYVYIPLGGNRNGTSSFILNILIAFSLSGLWHGASWNFVIWGALHGLYVILERVFHREKSGHHPYRIVLTFLVVTFTWIFFRATTWSDAVHVITHLFQFQTGVIGLPQISTLSFLINFILIGILISSEAADFTGTKKVLTRLIPNQRIHHYTINALLIIAILVLGVFEEQSFIYFQF
ncbi:MAG TPA: MBOAT family O-acyltransferase [Bacteroidia bacterium]|nr:MBOAT family O-acyltransferase [Bacteroidia bacterium]